MRGAALIRVEGVLSAETEAIGVPVFAGKMLVLGLHAAGVQPLFVTSLDTKVVSQWVEDEVPTVDKVKLFGADIDDPLREARYLGYSVQFFATSRVDEAVAAFDAGVVPMFMPHPEYARPEFRPDARVGGVRPWGELQDVVEKRREQLRNDKRLVSERSRYEDEDV